MVASNPELQAFGEAAEVYLEFTTAEWRAIPLVTHALDLRHDLENFIDILQNHYATPIAVSQESVTRRGSLAFLHLLFVRDVLENL